MHVRLQVDLPRTSRRVPEARRLVSSLLEQAGAPSTVVEDMALVVTEACANVVHHATGSDRYGLSVALAGHACEVEVVDRGPGFASPAAGDPEQAAEEAGRGLGLMRALADEVHVRRDGERTCVRFVKRWGSGSEHDFGSTIAGSVPWELVTAG